METKWGKLDLCSPSARSSPLGEEERFGLAGDSDANPVVGVHTMGKKNVSFSYAQMCSLDLSFCEGRQPAKTGLNIIHLFLVRALVEEFLEVDGAGGVVHSFLEFFPGGPQFGRALGVAQGW